MKRARGRTKRGRQRTTPEARAALVARFERSGDSAAAFARQHDIAYSTFCAWRRQQRTEDHSSPGFVEVALDVPSAPVGLVVELAPAVRLRLTAPDQVGLAAQLIRALEDPRSC